MFSGSVNLHGQKFDLEAREKSRASLQNYRADIIADMSLWAAALRKILKFKNTTKSDDTM